MSRLFIKHVGLLSDQPLEIYWLAGLRRSEEDQWSVGAALRECESNRLINTRFPIGALALLSLGRTFSRGELDHDPYRGECGTALIQDLSQGQVVTSADIDPRLYSFGGRPAGVQRLFEFSTPTGRLLIPAIELVRFLFLRNRALAQCIMQPESLNLLYHPQMPGEAPVRRLRFSRDLPRRYLTKEFVREFTWITLDRDARRAWESVSSQSMHQDYVLLEPPPIRNASCNFRGVRYEDTWLVLEILSLSGRTLPCSIIEFSHPRLRRTIRMKAGPTVGPEPPQKLRAPRAPKPPEILVEPCSALSDVRLIVTTVAAVSKAPSFDNPSLVQAVPEKTRIVPVAPTAPPTPTPAPEPSSETRVVKVSAGGRGVSSGLPPIEFRQLEKPSSTRHGSLESLYQVAVALQELLPESSITANPCFLKEGRAFSLAGLERRTALIVIIATPPNAPIVLVDVERTGITALALMALHFHKPSATNDDIEISCQTILDALVENGGSWDSSAEARLTTLCRCERHPRALFPREGDGFNPLTWARRLAERLGLL